MYSVGGGCSVVSSQKYKRCDGAVVRFMDTITLLLC
jgi:hypothetical protein